jgi:hypothetical protein
MSTQSLPLAPVQGPSLPEVFSNLIENKRGKVLGERFSFIGDMTAASVAASGRAAGMKGRNLKNFVNSTLTGNRAVASEILATAWVRSMAEDGYVPTVGERRKNTGVLKMEKAQSFKSSYSKDSEIASLKAELEAIKAKLASK